MEKGMIYSSIVHKLCHLHIDTGAGRTEICIIQLAKQNNDADVMGICITHN